MKPVSPPRLAVDPLLSQYMDGDTTLLRHFDMDDAQEGIGLHSYVATTLLRLFSCGHELDGHFRSNGYSENISNPAHFSLEDA